MHVRVQGKSLDQTLHDALQLVPNPHDDPGILQLNRIRCGMEGVGVGAAVAAVMATECVHVCVCVCVSWAVVQSCEPAPHGVGVTVPRHPLLRCRRESLHLIAANSTAVGLPQASPPASHCTRWLAARLLLTPARPPYRACHRCRRRRPAAVPLPHAVAPPALPLAAAPPGSHPPV